MKVYGEPTRSIRSLDNGTAVEIVDQTLLPYRFEKRVLGDWRDCVEAIRTMRVRGAPLIGITGAWAVVLAVKENPENDALLKAAADVLDGDISKTFRFTSQNIVNSQPGVYNVTAQVDSRLGEPVVLPLKVVITTGETQLIWLKDYLIYLPQGASFDAAGYIDSVVAPDGSTLAASQVSVDDPVNTSVPGVYYVGYTVAAQGQSYTVYLTVVVE